MVDPLFGAGMLLVCELKKRKGLLFVSLFFLFLSMQTFFVKTSSSFFKSFHEFFLHCLFRSASVCVCVLLIKFPPTNSSFYCYLTSSGPLTNPPNREKIEHFIGTPARAPSGFMTNRQRLSLSRERKSKKKEKGVAGGLLEKTENRVKEQKEPEHEVSSLLAA